MSEPMAVGIGCIGLGESQVVVLDSEGDVLLSLRLPVHINYNEQVRPVVAEYLYCVMKYAISACNSEDTVDRFFRRGGRVCAGITGITTAHNRGPGMATVWDSLEFPPEQCLATGDAEVMLPDSRGSLDGLVLVWDAGSVVYARSVEGVIAREGGWGPLMGDEGSGYYMGRKALHALTWHRNRYKRPCRELVAQVRAKLDCAAGPCAGVWQDLGVPPPRRGESDAWIDYLVPYCQQVMMGSMFRYAVAGLADAVVNAAEEEQGKGIASRILAKSLNHLASHVLLAVQAAAFKSDTVPMTISGYLPMSYPDLQGRLLDLISERVLARNRRRKKSPPLPTLAPVQGKNSAHAGAGAALLALSGRLDGLPPRKICKHVYGFIADCKDQCIRVPGLQVISKGGRF